MALKTYITLMLAGAVGTGLVAFADPPRHAKGETLPPGLAKQGKVPPGHAKKMWKRGEYLPADYRDDYFEDWRRYDLREAPPGYRWVIVDEDAYLTQVATGLVAEAVIDLLN
ncbi:RcnB family protein [Hyphomonas pacifica]|uniref:RcnB family protein n=1 Tax=Hyphomonas pacifica TaxID=1280941 RepID=UPI000DD48CD6|nr:RcnB family protein [Hyphomonas pacifica]